MQDLTSFGAWLKWRRRTSPLTRKQLARLVACSEALIRKIEEDERRPSEQIAGQLAKALTIPVAGHPIFIKVARGEAPVDQLSHVDVPPPPLTRRAAPPTNLPAPTTPLIGRERETALVRQRLQADEVRLVTLTGPGGTGKTRLALAVAATVQDDFADGAYFVDLAPIHDPDFVLAAVATKLGVTASREQPLLAALQAYLREKQLLLVLDNFEQVLAAAPLLDELLQAAPRLKLLVTSRIVLGVYAEQVIVLPSLELPDLAQLPPLAQVARIESVRLFVERAVAANAAFALTEANVQAVAEVCHRLDGLPLAIELAAARMRILPPAALLSRLDQRLSLLTGGGRTRPPRQQTLRATLDWSYSLLAPQEQTLFARLGVFVGGWTVKAVEAICTSPDDRAIDVLDRLQALLDNSLILQAEAPDNAPRFRMYETIREYALEHLSKSGEEATVRQRHSAYYLQLAETAAPQLFTAERTIWLERLEVEHDNLRAALGWSESQPDQAATMLRLAAALTEFWREHREHLDEGVRWFERAFASKARVVEGNQAAATESLNSKRMHARALLNASDLAHTWGALAQASAYANKSIALYDELDDSTRLADALAAAGIVARTENDDTMTVLLLEQSVALLRQQTDRRKLWEVLRDLGLSYRLRGDYARSEAAFAEALEIARTTSDSKGIALGLLELGTLALHESAPARAVSMLEECVSLDRAQESSSTFFLGWALIHLAEALRVVCDPHASADSVAIDHDMVTRFREEGLSLLRQSEARPFVAQALLEGGEIAYEQGDDARAAKLLAESLATFQELGLVKDQGHVLDSLAVLWAQLPQPAALLRAVRLWSAATKWHQNKPRLSPVRRSRYERTYVAVRAQLGEAAFAAAWSEGQNLSLEQAIAEARKAAGGCVRSQSVDSR